MILFFTCYFLWWRVNAIFVLAVSTVFFKLGWKRTELVSWGLEGVVCAKRWLLSLAQRRRCRYGMGFRCVPENGVKVEEVLLMVGEQVGAEFIHSASRMNKAVVVFMSKFGR